jgi:glycosyltransferase involved in cell wall biosynthesis
MNRSADTLIVHLTVYEALSSVYMAQVLRPMELVAEKGFNLKLCALAPIGQLARVGSRRRWRLMLAETRDRQLPFARLPSSPSRLRSAWCDAGIVGWWLGRQARDVARLIVHCRGTSASEFALAARARCSKLRVLSDCRGVDAPEMLMAAGFDRLEAAPAHVQCEYFKMQARQHDVLRQADAVVCVSQLMRSHIEHSVGPCTKDIGVVPCCTDVDAAISVSSSRDAIRRRLGLSDKFVIAYNGSSAPWQSLKESIALYLALNNLNPQAHFLAITTHPEAVGRLVREAGIALQNSTVLSLPQRDVMAHLVAADVGLLLRDAGIVNEVASPVKFAEYLAAGVPVILTESIGDASKLVEKEGIGYVLSGLEPTTEDLARLQRFITSFSACSDKLRQRCQQVAKLHFSWERHLPTLYATYRELS